MRDSAFLLSYRLNCLFTFGFGNHLDFHLNTDRREIFLFVSIHAETAFLPCDNSSFSLSSKGLSGLFFTFFAALLNLAGKPSKVLLTQLDTVSLEIQNILFTSLIEQEPEITESVTFLTNSSPYFIGELTSNFVVQTKIGFGGDKSPFMVQLGGIVSDVM